MGGVLGRQAATRGGGDGLSISDKQLIDLLPRALRKFIDLWKPTTDAPIVYLVAMFALGLQTERVGRRVANLLPADERKGAWGYDPDLPRTLNVNESPWNVNRA